MIPRLQLFELEDQPWCPAQFRDYATDYLHALQDQFRLFRPLTHLLAAALRATGQRHIVDLCSGAGGPVPELQRALAKDGVETRFTLTDRFPHRAAFQNGRPAAGGAITYLAEPVDATAVPSRLRGFRTLFNAFHHFAPDDAGAILRSAAQQGQPIGIFELPQRTVASLLFVLLTTPLLVLILTPLIQPFSWRRLFWTYLVPVVPLLCWWDAVVSHCRAYTPTELKELGERASAACAWFAGRIRIPGAGGSVTFLLGLPRTTALPRRNEADGLSKRMLIHPGNSAGASIRR
jgi:hypothetical protein